MNENRLKKIRRAKFMFLQKKPFWSGVLTVPVEIGKEFKGVPIEVAATDGKTFYLNEDYLDRISPSDLTFDLAHEYLHILLSHIWDLRLRIATNDVEWEIANMAADYVTNAIIKEEFGYLPSSFLFDEKYTSKTFEQVYRELMKNFQGIGEQSQCGQSASGGQSEPKSGQGEENSRGKNTEGKKRLQGHKIWKHSKENDALGRTIRQSLLRSFMQGTLPASLKREVLNILHPPLPISEIISSFVLERSYSKRNWKRLHKRRYPPLLYPQIKGRNRLQICVAIDTSGSIDTELLSEFKAGMQFLFSYFKGDLNVLLLQCDAKVQVKHWIHSPEELDEIEWKGGGGTDFRPVFKEIEKYPELRGLIYITDTYGTSPNSVPNFPVIWLVPDSLRDRHQKLPFGRVVFYDGGRGREE
ncbi:MAG: hypothetical protein FHOMOCKG_00031 [Methanophagales virus GBV302]|uniref:Uncharacterized protein n=1 Tax=Methanophagales virus GBV302 TaxID=2999281 RepID=A0A9E8V9F5_9CAUD|nr:MAG: hypothetical protein QIT37_gp031 [Methanophagales virus GBV302]WAE39559.1 MAG: hypothetical protein FHOMOCKG_00031 [Methanophagales virus GBV302]